MTNWMQLRSTANLSADDLKISLPLEFVIGISAGLDLDENLKTLCVWHDDQSPSLNIWGANFERWGCFACGIGGDLFDFIKEYWKLPAWADQIAKANELYQDFLKEAPGWRRREAVVVSEEEKLAKQATFMEVCRDAVMRAQNDLTAIKKLIEVKKLRCDPEWLRDQFFVGALDDKIVVIPELSLDEGGNKTIRAYKTRIGSGKAISAAGSSHTELYGKWRCKGNNVLLVVEGHSDCWTVAWDFRNDPVDVVSVPSGINQKPRDEWIDFCGGKNVVLVFDPDPAGRRGAENWWRILTDPGNSNPPAEVRIVHLDEGLDASDTEDSVLRRAIMTAEVVPPTYGQLRIIDGNFGWIKTLGTGQNQTFIDIQCANYSAEVETEIRSPEGDLAGFILRTNDGRLVDISTDDFKTNTQFKAWGRTKGLDWRGDEKLLSDVYATYKRQGVFTRRAQVSNQLGPAPNGDRAFLLPTETLGHEKWIYKPGDADAGLEEMVNIKRGPSDSKAIFIARDLHRHDVTDPILAWLAIAPLRGLSRNFPVLGVEGEAGAGKTTVLRELFSLFGWNTHYAITNLTPHAVYTLVGASTGVPIWFDEWRPDARPDTLSQIGTAMRAAWDKTRAMKGGGDAKNYSKIHKTAATAPMCISGEDAFTEQSLLDRSCVIRVPRDMPDGATEALEGIREARKRGLLSGFGRQYLQWLIDEHWTGLPETVGDRRDFVLEVIGQGWDLLREYVNITGGGDIGEPDFSRIGKLTRKEKDFSWLEVVRNGLETLDYDKRKIAWEDGEYTWIRASTAMAQAQKLNLILPGNSSAFIRWIEETMKGTSHRLWLSSSNQNTSDIKVHAYKVKTPEAGWVPGAVEEKQVSLSYLSKNDSDDF